MITIQNKIVNNIPVLEMVLTEKQDQALPIVFWYHGITHSKDQAVGDAYQLAKNGIRVILPDAALHGDLQDPTLVGQEKEQFLTIIIETAMQLQGIKNHYQEAGLIEGDRIGVMGLSMGGFITSIALVHYPWIKAAVVLMGCPSPSQYAVDILSASPDTKAMFSEAEIAESLAIVKNHDLSLNPQALNGRKVLFWHGLTDQVVPHLYAETFVRTNAETDYGANLSFLGTPNVGHYIPFGIRLMASEYMVENI